MGGRNRRIAKEVEDCQKQDSSNLTVRVIGDDLSHLKGTFEGPTETPYEGGRFTVDIQIPPDYPFRPPKMKFDTKIYHPNISSQTGAICLDILKEQWSPVLTVKSALVSLQSMLNDPQANDPQDAEVASVYLKDRQRFDQTAREWTQQYAMTGVRPSGSSSNARSSGAVAASRAAPPVDPFVQGGFETTFVEDFLAMGYAPDKFLAACRKLGVKSTAEANRLPGGLGQLLDTLSDLS